MLPSWLFILVIVLVVTSVARSGGKHTLRRKQCHRCGGIVPDVANYCGQCGKAFKGRGRKRHRRSKHVMANRRG